MSLFTWQGWGRTLLLTAVLVAIGAVGVRAQTWICGKYGDNVIATRSGETLTISGKGAMVENKSIGGSPWHNSRGTITKVIIKDGVTTIEDYMFYEFVELTSVTIPNGVTSIGRGAFAGSNKLASVIIPNSVINVGKEAFSGCTNLKSTTIGNSVAEIGDSAFSGCTNMTSITIPNSVTKLGWDAFSGCIGLTSVSIGNSVKVLNGFSGCTGLTSITIPNTVTGIGHRAFSWCTGLTSITIPNGVTGIGDEAFSRCTGLTSITIPNSVTEIGAGAFSRCTRLTSITIPNDVTYIAKRTFDGCAGLTSIAIPNGVTYIGDLAFDGCTGLTSITIPNRMASFGVGAFLNCSNLTTIISLNTTPPKVNDGNFPQLGSNKTINIHLLNDEKVSTVCVYVPQGRIEAYQSAHIWKKFTCIREIGQQELKQNDTPKSSAAEQRKKDDLADKDKELADKLFSGDPNKKEDEKRTEKNGNYFTDPRDGQKYSSVNIGGKTWMAQNLNFQPKKDSWCHNDNAESCKKFGRLYDWWAAKAACPAGWHLPSSQEWNGLIQAVGGNTAGKALKKANGGWQDGGNAVDNYGFSAMPGGSRNSNGSFIPTGSGGWWWAADEIDKTSAPTIFIHYLSDGTPIGGIYKTFGLSVRCVQN